MANPDVTAGRPTGDTQSHDHLKRDRSYSFTTGGTTVAVPHSGNSETNGALRSYDSSGHGGADVTDS